MIASIDIGSNTIRLLIAEKPAAGPLQPVRYERRITRLAAGLTRQRGLQEAAMTRTLAALEEFAEVCRSHQVTACHAVGTAAFRNAADGDDFARCIRDRTGIAVSIITGADEARLTADGVCLALVSPPDNLLMFDIGGGSTEFIHMQGNSLRWADSFPLGVVRLSEVCPDHVSVAGQINRQLDRLPSSVLRHAGALTAVGTAGTVTSLAAMQMEMTDYDWRRVNNATLHRNQLEELRQRLLPLSPADRELLPGLEPGRGDLIVPGLQIVLGLLDKLGCDRLTVSDFGVLEGVALLLAEGRIPADERSERN